MHVQNPIFDTLLPILHLFNQSVDFSKLIMSLIDPPRTVAGVRVVQNLVFHMLLSILYGGLHVQSFSYLGWYRVLSFEKLDTCYFLKRHLRWM